MAPNTSQSPAVRLILVRFVPAPLDNGTADVEGTIPCIHCPIMPDAPFVPLVMPVIVLIPCNELADVTVKLFRLAPPDEMIVVAEMGSGVTLPYPAEGGDANVDPPRVAALIPVLHVNPVLVVQPNALAVVLQLGIANAVGAADADVALANTVFAAIAASPDTGTPPHAGAVDDPVEMIACPLDDPAGFSN